MGGSWQPLNNKPPSAVDTMLLLTDGSVMCHGLETPNWYKLVPDALSDYANGTWQTLTPQPANAPLGQGGPVNAPLYFSSAVLKDGRVLVAGGEYNVVSQVDLLAVEIYDPVADSWTSLPNPPGFGNIGDAPSCVLPDGRVLMGDIFTSQTVILDPVTRTWIPGGNKADQSSEETWTLLPDGTILDAEVNNHPQAEKYLIATNTWVSASSIPPANDLVLNEPGVSIEVGPAILMNDGRVFHIGATGHTALYTPPINPVNPGSWAGGPDFPVVAGNLERAFDAPAALLPNGNVLCVVGPKILFGPDAGWSGLPTDFFEFDGVTLTPVASPSGAASMITFTCRLLLLPTGQVLLSDYTDTIQMYTPSGAPHPAWKPQITHVSRELHPGHVYKLRGRQLNGRSQAVCYGDDAQMATNYPLVRLQAAGGGGMFYCRTFDHSTMAVATGAAIHHTHFAVPLGVPFGHFELVVIANGIPSDPINVCVEREEEEHEHRCHEEEPEKVCEKKCEEKPPEKEKCETEVCKREECGKYKDKDAKEAKEKEKDVKEVKEKEHEHLWQPRHESHEFDEAMEKIGHLAERFRRVESAFERAFIREEERPHVGERALKEEGEEHEKKSGKHGFFGLGDS